MAKLLQSEGLKPTCLEGVGDRDALLQRCGARYLTDGLASIRGLPDESVDFMWS